MNYFSKIIYLLSFIFVLLTFSSVKAKSIQQQLEDADQLLSQTLNLENNELFESNIRQVIKLYESALSKNSDLGGIDYNLGNCYFFLKEYPKAVFYYKKALLKIPENPYILNNLHIARKKIPQVFKK